MWQATVLDTEDTVVLQSEYLCVSTHHRQIQKKP